MCRMWQRDMLANDYSVEQERQKLLSFVIVGGGPTGVEVAAELHDMIRVKIIAVSLQKLLYSYKSCLEAL